VEQELCTNRPGLLETLQPRPGEDLVIFDVGANIGIWSIYAARLHPQALILALEPIPEVYELLLENLAKNGLGPSTVAHGNFAISDEAGHMTLGWLMENHGGASHQHATNALMRHAAVQTMRLETLMDTMGVKAVDLVKLDIEGMEYQVLWDISPACWKRIRAMTVEFHGIIAYPEAINRAVYDEAERFLTEISRDHGVRIEVRRIDKPTFIMEPA
jgi:FkbM family methyltransferase